MDKEDRELYLPGKVLEVLNGGRYKVACEGEEAEEATYGELFSLEDFVHFYFDMETPSLKPKTEQAEKKQATGEFSDSDEESESITITWQCVCTAVNKENDMICNVCHTRRPRKSGMKRDLLLLQSKQAAAIQSSSPEIPNKRPLENPTFQPAKKKKTSPKLKDHQKTEQSLKNKDGTVQKLEKRIEALQQKLEQADDRKSSFEEELKVLQIKIKRLEGANEKLQKDNEQQKEEKEKTINQLVTKLAQTNAQLKEANARVQTSEKDREDMKQIFERYQQDISTCKKQVAKATQIQSQQNASIAKYQDQIREWGRKWRSQESQLNEALRERDRFYSLLKQANPDTFV